MQMVRMQLKSNMKKQIEEIEELRILSIIFSTKEDMLLLIGEAKYKLVLEDSGRLFGCKIRNMF